MLAELSEAIESRDPCMRGHSARVTALADAVARWLGWDEEQLRLLHLGGALHDIGKLAVPGRILRKPGPLDAEELLEIRAHPEAGVRLITSSVNSVVPAWPLRSAVRTPSETASSAASRIAREASCSSSPPYESRTAPPRIIANGFATFLPCSEGAVPCAASAITARGT